MNNNELGEYRQTPMTLPPGATRILLIRHGASEPARADRRFPLVDGQGDPGLAPEGFAQAERVAERLAGVPLDALYVTTLRRTALTAAPLARLRGLTPIIEAGLREVHLGDWEGGEYRRRVAENDPLAQRARAAQRWDLLPGAENDESFAARVRGSLERLATAHTGQQIAVFTHGGVIGQTLALATGSRPFAFLGADNGSISQLVLAGPTWIVRRYNDTAHLDPSFSPAAVPLT